MTDRIEFIYNIDSGDSSTYFRATNDISSYPRYMVHLLPNGETVKITVEKITPVVKGLDNA